MAKLLSDATARRLERLLDSGDTTAARRPGGGGGPLWSFVRCDSDTAVGGSAILDQCYPATILRPASDFPAPPEEMAGVLLTVLGDGGEAVKPVAGMPYPCILTGEVIGDRSGSGAGVVSGRRRAFSVAIPVTPDDGDDTGDTSGGSGTSDDGCGRAVATATFENTDGVLKLTAKRLDVANDNGRLILKECDTSTTQYTVGPRSPVNPRGTPTAVVNQVCPVFTTLDYTDADGNPQTIQVVTGLKAKRKLIVAAVADDAGCIESEVDACCGSGSGSGDPAKCTTDSHYCPDGQSTELTLSFADGSGDIAQLFYVENPDDGNTSRWLSADGTWDLRYDADLAAYILTNLDTGFVWYAPPGFWNCDTFNTMSPVDPETQPNLQIDQVNDCTHGVGYVCVDGTCYEVPASLADFDTLAECEAACPAGSGSGSGSGSGGGGGSVESGCCPGHAVLATLHAHFSGALASFGTVTLAYDGFSQWVGTANNGAGCNTNMQLRCGSGGFSMTAGGPGTVFSISDTPALSCDPFVWTATGTAGLNCAGAFGVTVNTSA